MSVRAGDGAWLDARMASGVWRSGRGNGWVVVQGSQAVDDVDVGRIRIVISAWPERI